MWYVIIFASFLNIASFDVDTRNEFVSQKDCMKAAYSVAKDLNSAMLQAATLEQKLMHDRPVVMYSCKKLPMRKS
jgi:hypothetical protein